MFGGGIYRPGGSASGDYLPLAGGTLTGSLVIASGQTLTVANDTDASTILGRARIDSRTTDIAFFSHVDGTTVNSANYNVNANGHITVNAASARSFIISQSNVSKWQMYNTANFGPAADNALDFGQTSTRIRRTYLGEYMEISEMTAPAAPPADRVHLYCQDNGAGKTQLMALFQSGVAQQVAIEP